MAGRLPFVSEMRSGTRRWIELLTGRPLGDLSKGIEVRRDDGSRVVLPEAPKSEGEEDLWHREIYLPASRALLSEGHPMFRHAFGSSGARQGAEPVRVLRVAIGVNPQTGPLRLERVTVLHLDPWNVTATYQEPDGLLERIRNYGEPWDGAQPPPKVPVERRVRAIVEAFEAWCDGFLAAEQTLAAGAASDERRREELRELEAFYDAVGREQPLLGPETLPDVGAVDADRERRRRLLALLARFEVGFEARVLSVAEILCGASQDVRGNRQVIHLPFLDRDGVTAQQAFGPLRRRRSPRISAAGRAEAQTTGGGGARRKGRSRPG